MSFLKLSYGLVKSKHDITLLRNSNGELLYNDIGKTTLLNDYSTLCLKKVSNFKLSVTLLHLNRFSKFLYEVCYKPHTKCHLTLGMLLHYLKKLKIFCRYSADMEENANRLHFYRL